MNGVRSFEPVNWQRIVLDIRHACFGRGFQRQYKALGIDERTINRLARGEVAEPRYSVGVRLLQWYAALQSPDQRNLPFRPQLISNSTKGRAAAADAPTSSLRAAGGVR